MRSIAIAVVLAAALAGCASTEVLEYHAAPGQEVLTGKGGAMKRVEGIDVWLDGGSPPREFRILAQSKTGYRTGTAGDIGQRNSALAQLADEAKKRGADAVIVYGEESEIAGFVNMPGASTTTFQASGYNQVRATTTSTPGVMGAGKSHTMGALFVKYEVK